MCWSRCHMGLDSELVPGLSFAVSLHPNAAGWCESLYFSARFLGGGRARARAGLQEHGLTPAELMSAWGHSSVSVGRPKETDPGAQEGFFPPTRTFTSRLEAALGRKNRLAPSHSLLPGAATWVWGPWRPLLPSPGLRLSGVELVLFFPARPVSVRSAGPSLFCLGPAESLFCFSLPVLLLFSSFPSARACLPCPWQHRRTLGSVAGR